MDAPKAISDWALMRAALKKEIAFMRASGFVGPATIQRLEEKLAETESGICLEPEAGQAGEAAKDPGSRD